MFLEYRLTTKQGHGPIDPPIIKTSYLVASPKELANMVRYGAVFENGALNLDRARWGDGKVESCDDNTSIKEIFINHLTGLSPDTHSYLVENKCNSGTSTSKLEFRKAQEYLMFRLWNKGFKAVYGYCWI